MATLKNVQQSAAPSATVESLPPLVALAYAIHREAEALSQSDTKAGEFATGTAILGLANRAAYQVQALTEKMDAAKRLAHILVREQGLEVAATELQRQRDNYSWAMTQRPTYEAIYKHCETTWTALKGTRMPDQHPSKSKPKASADDLAAWLEIEA